MPEGTNKRPINGHIMSKSNTSQQALRMGYETWL